VQIAALTGLSVSAAPSAASRSQDKPNPRLSRPEDLSFFEQPDRDQWQRPDQIMDALKIADGDMVAEVGAGSGWFMVRLSRRVGPNGRVFAEDIQPPIVELLKRRVQNERLPNVETVLGTATDPRLPAGRFDAVLIVDVYHEMEDPVALLKNIQRSLKPKGCIGVVDFTPGGGGPGPDPDEHGRSQRVDPADVVSAATAAGLMLNKREELPPFQFVLVFAKDDSACR